MTKKSETTKPAGARKVDITRLSSVSSMPVGVQVIRKGDPTPEPSDLPVEDMPAYARDIKDPEDHTNLSDRLDYICDTLNARYYRKPLDNGEVQLSLKLEDGTTLAGVGLTTADAFNQLLEKTTRFMAAGLDKETK